MAEWIDLFVDTNVFLHYRPIVEIDWLDLCAAPRVELVVCMPVIHELDEHVRDALLRERARRSRRDVQGALEKAGVVRDGVTLRVDSAEADPAEMRPPLVGAVRDDQIVWIMKRAQTAGRNVAIVTADLGMRLKCGVHGVKAFEPPAAGELASPADDQVRETKSLQRELAQLRDRRAVCHVEASSDQDGQGSSRKPEIRLVRRPPLDLDRAIAAVKNSYPLIEIPPPDHPRGVFAGLLVSDEANQRYNEELEAFYARYMAYGEAMNQFRAREGRVFRFSLWLDNTGTLPAEDIDVELSFPADRVDRLSADEGDDEAWYAPPPAPTPPEELRSWMDQLSRHPVLDPGILRHMTPIPERLASELRRVVFPPLIKKDGSYYRVTIRATRLRHNDNIGLGRYIAILPEGVPAQPFPVDVVIRDSTGIAPTEGQVVFSFVEDIASDGPEGSDGLLPDDSES